MGLVVPSREAHPQALHRAALTGCFLISTPPRKKLSRTGVSVYGANLSLKYPEAQKSLRAEDHEISFSAVIFLCRAPFCHGKKWTPLDVHLPPGDWYDFWTAQKHSSKDEISLHPTLLGNAALRPRWSRSFPCSLLCRARTRKPDGPARTPRLLPATIAMGRSIRTTATRFAYQKGDFLRANFTCKVSASRAHGLAATSRKSAYQPWWK